MKRFAATSGSSGSHCQFAPLRKTRTRPRTRSRSAHRHASTSAVAVPNPPLRGSQHAHAGARPPELEKAHRDSVDRRPPSVSAVAGSSVMDQPQPDPPTPAKRRTNARPKSRSTESTHFAHATDPEMRADRKSSATPPRPPGNPLRASRGSGGTTRRSRLATEPIRRWAPTDESRHRSRAGSPTVVTARLERRNGTCQPRTASSPDGDAHTRISAARAIAGADVEGTAVTACPAASHGP
jgi:hypothetical protein